MRAVRRAGGAGHHLRPLQRLLAGLQRGAGSPGVVGALAMLFPLLWTPLQQRLVSWDPLPWLQPILEHPLGALGWCHGQQHPWLEQ